MTDGYVDSVDTRHQRWLVIILEPEPQFPKMLRRRIGAAAVVIWCSQHSSLFYKLFDKSRVKHILHLEEYFQHSQYYIPQPPPSSYCGCGPGMSRVTPDTFDTCNCHVWPGVDNGSSWSPHGVPCPLWCPAPVVITGPLSQLHTSPLPSHNLIRLIAFLQW